MVTDKEMLKPLVNLSPNTFHHSNSDRSTIGCSKMHHSYFQLIEFLTEQETTSKLNSVDIMELREFDTPVSLSLHQTESIMILSILAQSSQSTIHYHSTLHDLLSLCQQSLEESPDDIESSRIHRELLVTSQFSRQQYKSHVMQNKIVMPAEKGFLDNLNFRVNVHDHYLHNDDYFMSIIARYVYIPHENQCRSIFTFHERFLLSGMDDSGVCVCVCVI